MPVPSTFGPPLGKILTSAPRPAPKPPPRPPAPPASTVAKIRLGLLGAISSSASMIVSGKPCLSGFHVLPPSVDLKIPPFVPLHAPFSHGPCRCSHNVASTS